MTKLNITDKERTEFDDETLQIISLARDCVKLAERKYKDLRFVHVAIEAAFKDTQSVLDNDDDVVIVTLEKEHADDAYVSYGNARMF
jgi:hypothetical protein